MEQGDKIIYVVSGEKGIIVATKEKPWVKANDVFGRTEVYPEDKDFLILFKDNKNEGNYEGEITVWEHEIEKI